MNLKTVSCYLFYPKIVMYLKVFQLCNSGDLEDIEMRIQIRRRNGNKDTSAVDVENACVEALKEHLGMQIIVELEETLDMKVEEIINGSIVIRLKPRSQESTRKLNMAIQNGELQRILGRVLDLDQVKSAANGCQLVMNVTTTSPVNEVDSKMESVAETMINAAFDQEETKLHRYRRSQRQTRENKSNLQLRCKNAGNKKIKGFMYTMFGYVHSRIFVRAFGLVLCTLTMVLGALFWFDRSGFSSPFKEIYIPNSRLVVSRYPLQGNNCPFGKTLSVNGESINRLSSLFSGVLSEYLSTCPVYNKCSRTVATETEMSASEAQTGRSIPVQLIIIIVTIVIPIFLCLILSISLKYLFYRQIYKKVNKYYDNLRQLITVDDFKNFIQRAVKTFSSLVKVKILKDPAHTVDDDDLIHL